MAAGYKYEVTGCQCVIAVHGAGQGTSPRSKTHGEPAATPPTTMKVRVKYKWVSIEDSGYLCLSMRWVWELDGYTKLRVICPGVSNDGLYV